MFDSSRFGAAQDRNAVDRLKALATAAPATLPLPAGQEPGWIDDTPPPPGPKSRIRGLADRWCPGRRLPMLAGGLALALVCVVVALLVSAPDKEIPPPVLPVAAVAPAAAKSASVIVVSVVGKVLKPGLVELPDGARVADAVRAAGGLSEVDNSGLNLARRLTDGEQVYVGVPVPAGVVDGPALSATPARVDLNTAAAAQLDELPGVSEVTARRIVDWRAEHGRFTSVDQLRQIDGIGESRFTKLRDLVTVR